MVTRILYLFLIASAFNSYLALAEESCELAKGTSFDSPYTEFFLKKQCGLTNASNYNDFLVEKENEKEDFGFVHAVLRSEDDSDNCDGIREANLTELDEGQFLDIGIGRGISKESVFIVPEGTYPGIGFIANRENGSGGTAYLLSKNGETSIKTAAHMFFKNQKGESYSLDSYMVFWTDHISKMNVETSPLDIAQCASRAYKVSYLISGNVNFEQLKIINEGDQCKVYSNKSLPSKKALKAYSGEYNNYSLKGKEVRVCGFHRRGESNQHMVNFFGSQERARSLICKKGSVLDVRSDGFIFHDAPMFGGDSGAPLMMYVGPPELKDDDPIKNRQENWVVLGTASFDHPERIHVNVAVFNNNESDYKYTLSSSRMTAHKR